LVTTIKKVAAANRRANVASTTLPINWVQNYAVFSSHIKPKDPFHWSRIVAVFMGAVMLLLLL